MTEARTTELEIPADSRFVSTARNFVADAALGAGWVDEDQLDDLRLIVSETVTNALRAHEDHRVDDLIRVRSIVSEDRIEIFVSDAAGGFEVSLADVNLPEPDLDNESGFGLPLIDALSDEAQFTSTSSGTTVRVVVWRRGARADQHES